jgi:hypothetical protein
VAVPPLPSAEVPITSKDGKTTPPWRRWLQKLEAFFLEPGAALTAQLTTITHTAPGTPDYAIQNLANPGFGFATADEGNTVLSAIANLQTRLAQIEARLEDKGLVSPN